MRRAGLIGAMLLVIVVGSAPNGAVAEPPPPVSTQTGAPRAAYSVSRNMSMNDPTHRPGTIARQLRTYVAHAPRGSTISIMSFYLSSTITWPALRAAYERGVKIRAVLYGGPQGRPRAGISPEGVQLDNLIREGRAQGRRGSYVVWTRRGARGKDFPSGVMHAKVWQFSQVGGTPKVTMIGSYNNGDPPDGRAYSATVTLTDPQLYGDMQSVFREAVKDRPTPGNPQRRFSGDGWDLYAFPSRPMTTDNDPVLGRLRSITAGPDTRMAVSMYSWQGSRGDWLARRLAAMVEAGARLTVVVGPDIAPSVMRTLRRAGARLEDGCWRTGKKEFPYAYTHDKEMTATWVEDGVRRHAAWIGSDDWGNGSGGSQSDQVTIGLYSRWAYTRLNQLLAPQIAHEPDDLGPCDPL